ncbi:unnamed protein product [Lactuca saligna]|uniref:Uncharacterized protein n=1 Tax=Lactuca saligna TaxID=75948 RepID=A0AA35V2X1_LACSI|nr:unnamed protein product [Lactuca saligna]
MDTLQIFTRTPFSSIQNIHIIIQLFNIIHHQDNPTHHSEWVWDIEDTKKFVVEKVTYERKIGGEMRSIVFNFVLHPKQRISKANCFMFPHYAQFILL